MKNKKILGLLSLFFFIGCSSGITVKRINRPAKENFKIEIKEMLLLNKEIINHSPEQKELILGNETYYFDRRIKIRTKVLDSLNILHNKKRIMIIDMIGDYNGERLEGSLFFYDEKIIDASYDTKEEIKNGKVYFKDIPKITEINIKQLKKDSQDIIDIYNYFNKENFDLIGKSFNCDSYFKTYYVTIVINKKVKYYKIISRDNCKVSKLQ